MLADYITKAGEKLKEHLASFETQYDRNQYLSKWLRYWLSARNYKIGVIYDTCLYIITEDGLDRTEGEILDLLFPLAFQFDHEKAFELFLKTPSCLLIFWGPNWGKRKITIRRNKEKIKFILSRKKKRRNN